MGIKLKFRVRVLGVFNRVKRAVKGILKPKKRPSKRPQKRLPETPAISALSLKPSFSPIRAIQEFSKIQLSRHTARAYERDLNDFFSYLRVQNLSEYWTVELRPQNIAEYRDFLIQEKKLAKGSVTRKLAVLKSFFKYAMAAEWMEKNPAELIKGFPQTQESKTGFLNEAEIQALLDRLHWGSDRLSHQLAKVGVETLLMLGLRRGEACRIRLGHIQFVDNQWLLRVEGKGDRYRTLPIPERLLETYGLWIQRVVPDAPESALSLYNADKWIDFLSRHKDQPLLVSTRARTIENPLSDSELARIVRKWSRKAGLVNRVSPHMLRASAITHALDQGASHRGIQQMAGWTSPLMITRYDKRKNDPKHSAVHKLRYAQKTQLKPELDVADLTDRPL
jgi:integrase/recombinase XerC